jgi:hypothetical protein
MQSIEGWNSMHGASAVESGNRTLLVIEEGVKEVNDETPMAWINVVETHHLRDRLVERVGSVPDRIRRYIARGLLRGKTVMRGEDRNILVEVRLPLMKDSVFVAGKFVAGSKFIAMTVLSRDEARALGWAVEEADDA